MRYQVIHVPDPVPNERLARLLARLVRQGPGQDFDRSDMDTCQELGGSSNSNKTLNP